MTPLETLNALLCDPSGKCCIRGSDEDRRLIDEALAALAAAPAQQPWKYTPPSQERIDALELEVRQLTEKVAALRHALRSQQLAPSAAPAEQQMVAYLDIGAGGYIDLGSELPDETLLRLPKGRHALVIAGTFGIDGYVAAAPKPAPSAAPAEADGWCAHYLPCECAPEAREGCVSWRKRKPSLTPQADSQPAQVLVYPPLPDPFIGVQNKPWGGHAEVIRSAICEDGVIPCFTAGQMVAYADATHAARAPADSVLEDAARWEFRWLNPANNLHVAPSDLGWKTVNSKGMRSEKEVLEDLQAYRHQGKPVYEVRPLFATRALEKPEIRCPVRLANGGDCPRHNLQCGWPDCNKESK